MVMPYSSAPIVGSTPAAGMAQPPQVSGAQTFADATKGIRSITLPLAAGFSKDPARRRAAQVEMQSQEEERQQQIQQLKELSLRQMDQLYKLAAGGAWKSPKFQQMARQAAQGWDADFGPGTGAQALSMIEAASTVPQEQDLVQAVDPKTGQMVYVPKSEAAGMQSALPSAPQTREVRQGNQTVTEEYDRTTGKWKEVGRGPAFAPPQLRSPTELEQLSQWLKSGDPQLVKAAEGKLGLTSKTAALSDVATLRSQYLDQSKNFQTVRQNYQIITNAEKTGAGDIARVFGFMKLLDPTSVVREGEQATAQNAAGVPSRWRAEYNRLVGGGTLDEQARSELRSQADRLYGVAEAQQKQTQKHFSDIATSQSIDPSQVVIDQTLLDSASSGNFSGMTDNQLLMVDPTSLSPDAKAKYKAELAKRVSLGAK